MSAVGPLARRHAELLASVALWGIPVLWLWPRMLRQAPDGLWSLIGGSLLMPFGPPVTGVVTR